MATMFIWFTLALSLLFAFDMLRHYTTFKVREFESLFCRINTCLQKTITFTGLQTEQIFSVNI